MTTQTKSKVAAKISTRAASAPKTKITRDHVARYLRTHSDFFTHHPDLIETLAIPHETGVAVSLVERQVELLRNKNKELDQKLHQLIKVAKDNEKVSHRLHAITLGLVSIRGFDDTLEGIHELMHADFPGTKVNMRLFDVLPETKAKDCDEMEQSLQKSKLIQDLFSSRRRGVAFLTKRQIENVFESEDKKKPIRSAAAVALKQNQQLGVLFLGSTDANRFQNGMGTLFLGNLGEILGAKLQQFVPAAV
ncbi:MAG: DUF484 family protein [Gammaproteobacteria bacterium]